MRAAFLIGSVDDYGANRVLLQDVEALAALGVQSTVIAPEDAVISDTQVARLAAAGAALETAPLHVFRRIDLRRSAGLPVVLPRAAHGADLVVVYTLALAGYLPLLRVHGVPTVLSAHEIVEGLPGRILGRLAALADLAVVNSLATANALRGSGFPEERICPIYPSSIPSAQAPPDADRSALRVLLAGRVNPAKGHADAIEAVLMARRAGVPAELTLVGAPFPGQERWLADLRAEVAEDPAVTYAGDFPDIGEQLARANLLLVASRRPESFGLVALEAWSAGRRAIAPAEGGTLEAMWLVDGLTFEPRSPGSLAQQLGRIWARPELLGAPDRGAPIARRCDPARRPEAWREVLDRHPRIESANLVPGP